MWTSKDFARVGQALRKLVGTEPSGKKFFTNTSGDVKPVPSFPGPSAKAAALTLTPEQRTAEKYRQAGYSYMRDPVVGEFIVPLAEMEARAKAQALARPLVAEEEARAAAILNAGWPDDIYVAAPFRTFVGSIEPDATYLESNPSGESWTKDRFIVKENLRKTAAEGTINILNPLIPGCGDPHCPVCNAAEIVKRYTAQAKQVFLSTTETTDITEKSIDEGFKVMKVGALEFRQTEKITPIYSGQPTSAPPPSLEELNSQSMLWQDIGDDQFLGVDWGSTSKWAYVVTGGINPYGVLISTQVSAVTKRLLMLDMNAKVHVGRVQWRNY